MRDLTPEDDVYRVNTVWLGPIGLTFPWAARYLAHATWLVWVIIVGGVTPRSVHIPPVWEISIATLATYGLMGPVDEMEIPNSIAPCLGHTYASSRRAVTSGHHPSFSIHVGRW